MIVVANGKPRKIADGATVGDFLAALGWKPEWVVVEHNGEALERSKVATAPLADGDRLEVVRAVSGGAG